jgi:hypothetical protein
MKNLLIIPESRPLTYYYVVAAKHSPIEEKKQLMILFYELYALLILISTLPYITRKSPTSQQ